MPWDFAIYDEQVATDVSASQETAEIGKVLYLLNTLGIDLIADTRD